MAAEKSKNIPQDSDLLQSMLEQQRNAPDIYRPGPYWLSKAEYAAREINRFGINDFRGNSSHIGTSYVDNAIIDVRGDYNYGLRSSLLSFVSRKFKPVANIFDSQVHLTKAHYKDSVAYKNQVAIHSPRIQELLNKYSLPEDTTKGGCLDACEINGKKISNCYLDMLDIHDVLARAINFSAAKSFFEIGGGFGVNLHLLVENYPNLKKFVYLDIAPNLYVGIQYLKSFYGDQVKSFFGAPGIRTIEFAPDDTLEILCITPDQIEQLNMKIDVFQNCRSFVEMPEDVTKNYIKHAERLMSSKSSAVGLVSYENFDLNTTYHPDKLPELFSSRSFDKFDEITLWKPGRRMFYYVSAS